jgi:hypothetical protein
MVACRVRSITLLILLSLGGIGNVRGALITSFQDALQPVSPAPGWAYLWNSAGPIGNPANYTPLLPSPVAANFYTSDGGIVRPAPPPGAFISIGLQGGLPGGHPGMGASQAGSGGIERYCIAAYTLTSPDRIAIVNGWMRNPNPNSGGSTDGVALRIFVNNDPSPRLISGTPPKFDSTTTFSIALGDLNAGDTIYVAMGPNNEDLFDSFQLRYDIVAVPEPGVVCSVAIAAGLVSILGLRFERRKSHPQ